MQRTNKKLIAVIGATGQQGGAVVHALQASNQFKVRALSRNPDKHRELADEVVEADLDRPETLLCYSWPTYRTTLQVTTLGEKIRKPSRLDRQSKTISPQGWRGIDHR